ncbi:MAG: hypothetical protein U9Q04_03730, partial [Campylobacterota bacterium]|nr:hypothetical protein [Campylobacterota bacterium]
MFFNIFKKKQLKTAQFINELYAKLNNCHSLKEISDISISFLSQNLSVSTGLFYILDNQNKQLNLSATYNISAKNLRFNIDLEDSMFIDSLQNKNIKIFNNIENLESKFNIFSPYGMKMAIIPILDEYKNIIAVSQFIYMDSLENYNDISDVLNIIAEHIIKYQKNKENKNYFNLLNKYIITSTTNKDGIINFASDAFCNVSGYTKLELIGKSHNILK